MRPAAGARSALLYRSLPRRRQAEAGWGAVKRSRRWEPGLHPHSPFPPRTAGPLQPEHPAGAAGVAASLERDPTEEVSASGAFPPRSPEQVKEVVCPLPRLICGSRGRRLSPGGYKRSRGGGSRHLGCPNPYPPPIGIPPSRAPGGLEPLRGGCHPRRPLPRAPLQELGSAGLTSARTVPL